MISYKSGSPSGTYHIYHATLKRILVSFEWPTGSYKFGHLIPVPVPKTSTNAGPTTTKATKTGSKTKSTTRFTTTCAPVYDGTSLPWLAWSDQTNGGDNDAVILDLDVDSAG